MGKQTEGGGLEGMPLPISNDIVFEFAMRDAETAKEVVETALGIEIDHVERHETQDVLSSSAHGKGIRLDVYLSDGKTCYDVEMQTTKSSDLGLRLRGYQSIIDASTMRTGDDYTDLKKSYIIFFCNFDPFTDMIPLYTFKPMCIESRNAKLSTEQRWLLFNAQAWKWAPSGELRSLLEYISTGDCSRSGETALTCRLEDAVARANADKNVMEEAMISLEKKREMEALYEVEERYNAGRAEGKAEGRAEGKAEGKAEGEENLARLIKALQAAGRYDQIPAVLDDPSCRAELMAEHGIG